MIFYNCSKCGLCLSDCSHFQKTRDENISPKSLIINNHFKTEKLDLIKIICKKCEKKCIALDKCPMRISLEEIEMELGEEL